MKYNLIKFKPKSSWHIGEREGWLEGTKYHVPSDTLFSALCHCYLLLYGRGELESLLEQFLEKKMPFLISSAFPYYRQTLFFPLPKNQVPEKKKLKKAKFVDGSSLMALLSGRKIDEVEEIKLISPEGLILQENCPPVSIWHGQNVARVGLSRWNNQPGERFFHFGEVHLIDEAGLFLLLDLKNKEFKNRIIACFNLLAHQGLGGDRSCGKGFFEKPEISESEIPHPGEANGLYCLSTYFPTREEVLDLNLAFYELQERRGYVYSPWCQSLRRKSIRAFVEGSVLPATNKVGMLADVTPEALKEHKVYRYGFIFSFPCQLEVT